MVESDDFFPVASQNNEGRERKLENWELKKNFFGKTKTATTNKHFMGVGATTQVML